MRCDGRLLVWIILNNWTPHSKTQDRAMFEHVTRLSPCLFNFIYLRVSDGISLHTWSRARTMLSHHNILSPFARWLSPKRKMSSATVFLFHFVSWSFLMAVEQIKLYLSWSFQKRFKISHEESFFEELLHTQAAGRSWLWQPVRSLQWISPSWVLKLQYKSISTLGCSPFWCLMTAENRQKQTTRSSSTMNWGLAVHSFCPTCHFADCRIWAEQLRQNMTNRRHGLCQQVFSQDSIDISFKVGNCAEGDWCYTVLLLDHAGSLLLIYYISMLYKSYLVIIILYIIWFIYW